VTPGAVLDGTGGAGPVDPLDPETLLGDLSPAQREAVTSDAAPLCILAGAGAGKTRVLTRRIAYRVSSGREDPAHVLALTFTRKAAAELSGRLQHLGLRDTVTSGTFHAVAAAELRRRWTDLGRRPAAVIDRAETILRPLVAERPAFAGLPLGQVVAHIGLRRAKQRRLERDESSLPVDPADLDALIERYQHEKLRRGVVDFDDLLERCADAIEADPAFAAAQRWRWRHVYVDEFQDLNPLQYRLLRAWLGPSADLCVVGDPHQAIYGWNGADPGLLADFPRHWPDAGVVNLDLNHRCSPQIVAAAAAVLGADGATLRSSRPDGPSVGISCWDDDRQEAAGIASALVAANARGRRYADMAVLARTNAQAAQIAEECRRAGVPVRVPGQTPLLDLPEVNQALAEWRRRSLVPVAVAAADLAEMATAASSELSGETSPSRSLALLAELALDAHRLDPDMTAAAWVSTLPALLGDDDPRQGATRQAVTVCSFHRAKGLEWELVWVGGLEEGLVPIGRASSERAVDEERRLLYVALTRAGDELHCSWARRRHFGGHPVPRLPSPWLDLIAAACDDSAGGRTDTTARWRQQLLEQRANLRSDPASRRANVGAGLPPGWPPPDGEVLDALRAWRSRTARASAVPAHVVLHDTVLLALASSRPSDEQDLLAVPGLGPVKASRFGETLLAIIASAGVPA